MGGDTAPGAVVLYLNIAFFLRLLDNKIGKIWGVISDISRLQALDHQPRLSAKVGDTQRTGIHLVHHFDIVDVHGFDRKLQMDLIASVVVANLPDQGPVLLRRSDNA